MARVKSLVNTTMFFQDEDQTIAPSDAVADEAATDEAEADDAAATEPTEEVEADAVAPAEESAE